MKYLFLVSSILLTSLFAQANQWIKLNTGLGNEELMGVQILDNNNIVAVGNDGVIIKSSDGGATWATVHNNPEVDYWGVAFSDTHHGWAVGSDGVIVKTNDGGNTWSEGFTAEGYFLTDVFFINQNKGWACDILGGVYLTNNGGDTWTRVNLGFVYNFYSVHFVNENIGFLAGSSEKILKTTDGGNTWSEKSSSSNMGLIFYDIYFSDLNNGWAVGLGGSIIRTTDGGETWQYIFESQGNMALSLWGVHFVNSTIGYVVGYNGNIKKSIDGGQTWNDMEVDYSDHLIAVDFTTDGTVGVAVGQMGIALKHETSPVSVNENETIQNEFVLYQNYPNPFNPTTKIKFVVPSNITNKTSNTKLIVYDILGKEIATLINEHKLPGIYEVEFNASELASGVYLYKLEHGEFSQIRKLMLLR